MTAAAPDIVNAVALVAYLATWLGGMGIALRRRTLHPTASALFLCGALPQIWVQCVWFAMATGHLETGNGQSTTSFVLTVGLPVAALVVQGGCTLAFVMATVADRAGENDVGD